MLIKNKDLELLLLNVLGKRYPRYLAQKITDVIMFGELSGNKSHGIVRIVDGDCSVVNQKPIKFPYIKKISSISRIIDGNENSAMLVAHLAMEEAIKIAQKKKIAIIGTRNTFSTSGCLSYYLNTIAQNDFISIIFAKSSDRAIHFGGLEKLYGSNPLAIGIPTNKDPILLDMSTTSMSWGEVLNAKRTKTNLPPQSAIDEFGNYTLNPANVFALVPFDRSYKGSGLAMMAEIFAGILTGSSFVNFDKEKGWGIFFLVFSPNLLMSISEFKKNALQLVKRINNSPSINGIPLRVPGAKSLAEFNNHKQSGVVDVNMKVLEKLQSFMNKKYEN